MDPSIENNDTVEENILLVEEPVAEPVVEEPVVEEPVVEEPVPEPEPVVEEPVPEPVVEESVPEPVVEEPVPEPEPEPVVEEPVPEPVPEPEPVVEEPVPEPVVEEPVPEPVVEEPVPEPEPEPVVEEPVPEPEPEPVVEEPVVEEPTPEPIQEPVVEEPTPEPTPKLIFIVPYRDREQQQAFFHNHMKNNILADIPKEHYKIWYIHQTDKREFNRGAMKNIGFLATKHTYPNDYKNITLIFNDVDTMPLNKNYLNYDTQEGNVKHFYGHTFALGGIVSIKAGDFERVNGFPNLWGWGYEDNLFQYRVLRYGGSNSPMKIDRDQFHKILDKNILQLKDGIERTVNRGEFDQYMANTTEGVHNITNLKYQIDAETGMVNVIRFSTGREENLSQRLQYDLRNGPYPFKPTVRQLRRGTMGMAMGRL